MKRPICIAIGVFCLVLIGQTAQAAVRGWDVDKVHTNFYFRIDHIFSKVNGKFNDFTAEIAFDPAHPEKGSFNFEINTDSVNTDIAKRDKHLQSSDFFDSGKYPLMTFTSTKITAAGNDVYQVAGKFTVKGVAYDLILPLKLAGIKEHPAVKGKEVIGFNGELTLDRLAYKVGTGKFYQMGLVGKDVEVLVTLEALSDKK